MSATRNKNTGNYRQERLENIHMNTINKYTGKAANNHVSSRKRFCPGEWVIRSCPITVAT
jgi:hypothetical protein